ncbi:hypothetical protein BDR06DRAFT_966944 [Suillus hirtellus]|nr:hypothetical protein BDR06DRAFT_966944 [Suillus hirtellus]
MIRLPLFYGKAAIPKPARGLGLNPSGLPAADQLNIPAEQPSVSAFGFNPYKDSMQQQSKGPDWHSFCGPMQYDDSHTSSSTSFSTFTQHQQDTFMQSQRNILQPHYGTSYNRYIYNQDGFGDVGGQPYSGSSLSNPQPNPLQPHDNGTSYDRYQLYSSSSSTNPQPNQSQPHNDSTSYKGYPYDQDGFRDMGDKPYNGLSLGMLRAPQEGTYTEGQALFPWLPIQLSYSKGRFLEKRSFMPNLPGTPYLVPQAPHSTTKLQTHTATSSQAQIMALQIPVTTKHSVLTLKTVCVSNDDINDVVKGGKVLIVWVMFTKHAMMQKQKKHITQFEDAIKDSMPHCLEADGSTIAATQTHHITMVNKLIWGIDPLLFMHAYSVDEHRNITIDAKFQNAFIMAGVICFVWHEGCKAFLGASPLKTIKYVMASVGSSTHCALQEQCSAVITVNTFHQEIDPNLI